MSKVFKINTNEASQTQEGWSSTNSMSNNLLPSNSPKHLFLFMIGGSGASVIEPLLYYFESAIYDAGYKIIPVFIDRHFHSEIISRSINTIKNYQVHCAYTAANMITHNTYLFIDDDSLFNENCNLNKILSKIKPNDIVAFAYSVCSSNQENIKVKKQIIEALPLSDIKILNLTFLPYFNIQFDDDEFLESKEAGSFVEFIDSNNNATLLPNEQYFYAGLPKLSAYTRSKYQRNPFNAVSLILSYALSTFVSKESKGNGFYHYTIEIKPTYNLDDLVPNSLLRQSVIKYDFKTICWNIICKNKALLPYGIESEIPDQMTMYFDTASQLIRQLQDKTIHKELQIDFRKQYDFDQIWKEFTRTKYGIIKRKHNESSFIKDLLSHAKINVMNTPNMVIHRTLQSIDVFINEHWTEIDNLYY